MTSCGEPVTKLLSTKMEIVGLMTARVCAYCVGPTMYREMMIKTDVFVCVGITELCSSGHFECY